MIEERMNFALKSLQDGVNFSELCAEYGISRKTGYKWRERYQKQGAVGLHDLSRKPTNSPNQLSEALMCQIVKLHERHRTWGPKKIRALLLKDIAFAAEAPSESSIKRVFDRCGWTRKRSRRKRQDTGRISSNARAEDNNDVWTVDFKGWWRTGDQQRCEPLTVRDEHSRFMLIAQPMVRSDTDSVRAVFEKLFQHYGLPGAIRSDNGSPFASSKAILGLSRLSVWWLSLGVSLERGRPGKPQDNGAHERMHRDIAAEVQSCAQGTLPEQAAALELWRETFNCVRPHEALGMKTPADVYKPSQRKYTGTPDDIVYPGMIRRRINKRGYLCYEKHRIPISTALAGWSVGLKPVDCEHLEVYFADQYLGQIELPTLSLLAGASPSEQGEGNTQKAS
ncbi:IS481 family transposase [Coraliomargarita parva]|uniref:IS481 family transposase n=1 Tax=Coraliomargarita parva TaxID=3014050 RepID=UPI0022B57F0D|nr:IS481 family transposase [Coraliomargarita parva]